MHKFCSYSRSQSGKFANFTTADHKVLGEGSESRNNHRYALVVIILSVQNKNFSGDPEEPSEVLGADEKWFTLIIAWHFASIVKNCPGIIVRQHHPDRKQMGLLREQCVESRKGHLRYCCNQVWTMSGGGKTQDEMWFGIPLNGPVIPFGAMFEYHPISEKDLSRLHHFGSKSLARYIPWKCIKRWENLEKRHTDRGH